MSRTLKNVINFAVIILSFAMIVLTVVYAASKSTGTLSPGNFDPTVMQNGGEMQQGMEGMQNPGDMGGDPPEEPSGDGETDPGSQTITPGQTIGEDTSAGDQPAIPGNNPLDISANEDFAGRGQNQTSALILYLCVGLVFCLIFAFSVMWAVFTRLNRITWRRSPEA